MTAGSWPFSVQAMDGIACGARLWKTHGLLRGTVVVKASFGLRHQKVMEWVNPDPVTVSDEHVDGNPERSLRAASDLAPYLPRCDVLFTGNAHAPDEHGRQSMAVRMAVLGSRRLLDKTLYVYGERTAPPEGSPAPAPAPFDWLPISYERAYRGSGFDENPAGVPLVPNGPMPNIVDPSDPEGPAGFGAIGANWPFRRRLLRGIAPAAAEAPVPELPDAFAWSYFHAAPPDQRCSFLEGNEWIVLDGLHPLLSRLQSQLPGVRAIAKVYGLPEHDPHVDMTMVADMLRIDAERDTCTVTWRGNFAINDEACLPAIRVVASMETTAHSARPVKEYAETPPSSNARESATGQAIESSDARESVAGSLANATQVMPGVGQAHPVSAQPGFAQSQRAPSTVLGHGAPQYPTTPQAPTAPQYPDGPRVPTAHYPDASQYPTASQYPAVAPQPAAPLANRPAATTLAMPDAQTPPLVDDQDEPAPPSDDEPATRIRQDPVADFDTPDLPADVAAAPLSQELTGAYSRDATREVPAEQLLQAQQPAPAPSAPRLATAQEIAAIALAPQREAQEAARQEAARQEAARQEAARQEAARQEAARQEAALHEAQHEAAQHEAAAAQGSSPAPSQPVVPLEPLEEPDPEATAIAHIPTLERLKRRSADEFGEGPATLRDQTEEQLIVDEETVLGADDEIAELLRAAEDLANSTPAPPMGAPQDAAEPISSGPHGPVPASQEHGAITARPPPSVPDPDDEQATGVSFEAPRAPVFGPQEFTPPATPTSFEAVDPLTEDWSLDLDEARPAPAIPPLDTQPEFASHPPASTLSSSALDDNFGGLADLLEPDANPAPPVSSERSPSSSPDSASPDSSPASSRVPGWDPSALAGEAPPPLPPLPEPDDHSLRSQSASMPPVARASAPPSMMNVSLRGSNAWFHAVKPAGGPSSVSSTAREQGRAEVARRLAAKLPLSDLDLRGADLSELDLAGQVLAGTDLRGATVRRSNLTGADLTGCNFGDADLSFAVLDDAVLDRVDLYGAQLADASLCRAKLNDTNFSTALGDRASFIGAEGQRTLFGGGHWQEANFEHAKLASADFTEAILDGAQFIQAELPEIRMYECRARNINMNQASLPGGRFDSANLEGSQFEQIFAPDSVWDQAHLDEASFRGAMLPGASFIKASCRRTIFSEAELAEARLKRARLEGAQFHKTDVSMATFEGADLRGASLPPTMIVDIS